MTSLFVFFRHIASVVASVTALVVLSACGTIYYWVKPGGSQSELDADKTECRVLAAGAIPRDTQQVKLTSGSRTPTMTNCSSFGRSVDCISTGGAYIPPTYYSYDANEGLRDDAVELCLQRKGWQRVTREELRSTSSQRTSSHPSQKRDWCPEIDNFCDVKGDAQPRRASPAESPKRDWCPKIDGFCR